MFHELKYPLFRIEHPGKVGGLLVMVSLQITVVLDTLNSLIWYGKYAQFVVSSSSMIQSVLTTKPVTVVEKY
jgi:hypothetical protein